MAPATCSAPSQKTGYADFWELYKRNELPRETQNYVPEILAAIIIANHPTQYGFDDVTLDPPVLTDTVTINYSIDLRLVSDLVGAPVDEIEALNPSLLRMVTPPEASFDLHLPAGTATLFEQRVALIPETRRNSWRYHPVVAGDTLQSVAQEYRVPVAELASPISSGQADSIAGIEALVVPVPPVAEPLARARLYIVRRGDTLVTIADRFGVSLSQLRRWNGIPSGIRVEPGRRLHVAEPAPVRTSTTHRRRTSATGASAYPEVLHVEAERASTGRQRRPLAPRPAPHTSLPAPPGRLRNSEKIAAACMRCICFACICVHAIATIACASRMFPSALAKKCERNLISGNPLEAMGWMKCSGCTR